MNWSKQISKKNMLVSSVILTIGLLSGCDNDADQPAIENPAVSVFQVKTEEEVNTLNLLPVLNRISQWRSEQELKVN